MKKTLLTIAAMALAICAANAQPGGMGGFGQRPQIDITFYRIRAGPRAR